MPDATAPAHLPSLVMIEVVGVSDRRHPGNLDESHQLGEPGDVRGVVSAWRSLGQPLRIRSATMPGWVATVTSPPANSVPPPVEYVIAASWSRVSSEGLPTSVKFAVVTAMRQYPPEGLILGKARTLW